MSVRVRFEWLFAFSLLAGGQAWAQGYLGPAPVQSGAPPVQVLPPEAYYGAGGQTYCPPSNQDLYAELLPNDRGWCYDTDSRRDLNLAQMLRGTFFRLEYLHGNIQKTDEAVLGTPINVADPAPVPGPAQDVVDVANQFLIIVQDTSVPTGTPTPTGLGYRYGQVPTTGNIQWNNAQGIRATFGVPVMDAMSIEGMFTGYMHQKAEFDVPTIPYDSGMAPGTLLPLDRFGNTYIPGTHGENVTSFLATSITTDGVPGSTVMLYDSAFSSYYKSRFLAGNVDMVFNWKNPELGFRAKPILGYRHEQYSEQMGFSGSFDNSSGYYETLPVYATPQTNSLDSKILNQRDQIELGIRNEFAFRYLTIGTQEKFGLGSNVVRSSVATDNFRAPGTIDGTLTDPATLSRDRRVIFAPTFDLDVYAKVRVTEWLNFRVGYNFTVLGNVGVADKSFTLNEVTDPNTLVTSPDIQSRVNVANRYISALTLGGEIILP